MAYSVESNKELKDYNDSKSQFITLDGINGRLPGNEAFQAIYNLTLVLPESKNKLTNPAF